MNRRSFLAGIVGVCASLLLPLPVHADGVRAEDERPPFDDKDALREWWGRQSPERREQLRERYERYNEMPAEKQRKLRERMGRWQQLSPEHRGAVRERWQKFRKLPPERQQRIRKNMDRWRDLDPQQREKLRKRYRRYDEMSPEQKKRVRERAGKRRKDRRKDRPRRPKNGGR